MPIYEYICRACGQSLERLQRLSEDPLTDCPACGEPQLVKKVSAAAFRLKGGGWYETDFKSGDKRNLATDSKTTPASTADSSASTGTSTSKTETKSATQPKAADA